MEQFVGDLSHSYASTYDVGWAVSQYLMFTNAIAELNGHALAEYPIHLIGHSRGLLWRVKSDCAWRDDGLWVDHVTSLDPFR